MVREWGSRRREVDQPGGVAREAAEGLFSAAVTCSVATRGRRVGLGRREQAGGGGVGGWLSQDEFLTGEVFILICRCVMINEL